MPRKSNIYEESAKMRREREEIWNAKKSDTLLLIVCFAVSVIFGILIYTLPRENFSVDENRMLADFPKITATSLNDSSFSEGLGNFYSDRFPARGFFTSLKAVCTLFSGRLENNGVIPAKAHKLVDRLEYSDFSLLEKNISALNEFCNLTEESDKKVCFFVAPRAIDVLRSDLPRVFDTTRCDEVWQRLDALYTGNPTVVTQRLRNMAERGAYVWYSTDHHWTTHGAYEAYSVLCEDLGIHPYGKEQFEKVTVTRDFLGTTYSSFCLKISAKYPDSITLYRYSTDDNFNITVNTNNEATHSLYDFSALDTKDKYEIFLGGNEARVSIYSRTEKRERLLLIKDSFANSVVPFLARHYDLEIIDLRYYKSSVYKLAQDLHIQNIVILYGVDTLVSDGSLTALRRK